MSVVPSFNIQYRAENESPKAKLTTLCEPADLSIGLKDICIYLRSFQSQGDEKRFYMAWEKNPATVNVLSADELKNRIEQIKNALQSAVEIESRMKMPDFILDGLEDDCDRIILSIEQDGIVVCRERYKKKINFLLSTIGEKLIVQNFLSVHISGFDRATTQQIMQEIYNDIPSKIKKHFLYEIDFGTLSFEPI